MELKRNTLNETKDMNEYKKKTDEGTKVTPFYMKRVGRDLNKENDREKEAV